MTSKEIKEYPKEGLPPEHPPSFIPPSARKAYDKDVTIEEYIHYARLTREEEKVQLPNPDKSAGMINQILRRPSVEQSLEATQPSDDSGLSNGHGESDKAQTQKEGRAVITADEWRDASRLMRTASCE